MGAKTKQKRTTKKTNWENIRSWVGAVLCIAVIVAVAAYVAKLVPSSSAYTPGPVNVKPANGTPITPNSTGVTFSDPIQITGSHSNPWEELYHFWNLDSFESPLDIHDGKVVFRHIEGSGMQDTRLFLYDMESEEITPIPLTEARMRDMDARIWGDNVVYETGCNIFRYHIPTGQLFEVTEDRITEQYACPNKSPDVFGDTIVWVRNADEDRYQIYVADISSGTKRKITNTFGAKSLPKVYDNKIVWIDARDNNWDIYLYDLKLRKESQITSGISNQTYPDIYEGFISWFDQRNYAIGSDNYDIYVHNIATGEEKRIILPRDGYKSVGSNYRMSIWKHFVMYNLEIDYTDRTFLYDLSSNKEYDLINSAFGFPVIYHVMDGPESSFIYDKKPSFYIFARDYVGAGDDMFMVKAQVF